MLSRPAPAQPDPADYGTCMGLEYTLLEPVAPVEPRAAAAFSWVRRLTSRAKPAP